jgi:D-serine deaminase-like pyridoxal phosphate-dependent protein
MIANLTAMQTAADKAGKRLRPHIKTHKSAELAARQIQLGANGVTVAKLAEAEAMAAAGIRDIFIANQITHPIKIIRLRSLHEEADICIGIDHPQQIQLLESEFQDVLRPLRVRIEIDSGLKRCGVEPGPGLSRLARDVTSQSWLSLEGLFTHAGQVYSARSTDELRRIARHEGDLMAEARDLLLKDSIPCPVISAGSTPAAPYLIDHEAVTEIRPGNYIFNDGIQVALGVASPGQCALFVLATVIAQPASDRVIIDAGSKALHIDRGAHAGSVLEGFGQPLYLPGKIVRLSEEHGVIQLDSPLEIELGRPVLILPNHACAVVNLYDVYHVIDRRMNISILPVTARGMLT